MYKDSIEYLINELEKAKADDIKEMFEVEKDGKCYLFEVTLKRK